MIVNKIQNTQQDTSFKASFKPSSELALAFDIAKRTYDEKFVIAVQKLLNNGKNDVIEFKPQMLNKSAYKGMILHINGEETLGIEGRFGFTTGIAYQKSLDISKLIVEMARLSEYESNKPVKNFYKTWAKLRAKIFKPKSKETGLV